jgi:hypothetical protein
MTEKAHSKPVGHTGNQKIILLVLAVIALATVFLLPVFVTGPWIAGDVDHDIPRQQSSAADVRPSTAAEKTRYRQESQVVLAQIIATRDRLTDMNVDQWAGPGFKLALQNIDTGDQQYSYGDYKESLASYEQALSQLTGLEELGNEKLAAALDDGMLAIESLNPVLAASSSELASAIAPDNVEAGKLAARLESLAALTEQLEAGDKAKAGGDLAAAQIAYQNAVAIDPAHQRAADALTAIKTEIVDSRFRGHMSRAYAALDNDDFETAQAAFNAAGTVYPGNAAVTRGLAQLENRNSQLSVNRQISRAGELESGEEWAQAVSIYESLLAQDASLAEVKVRLIPAKVRADLDRRLNEATEDPLGLSNRSLYQQAQVTLNDARGIPNPGEKLQGQIAALERQMKLSVSPVNVVFQSDNLTLVTLFKVKELGRFEQTSLTLRPGRYIAAGTRQGFRDVRVEFIITGEPLEEPIVVRCLEPV